MKLFTSNDFSGHWPVGTAAVVLAESEDQARVMIETELKTRGLVFNGSLEEVPLDQERVCILMDGDY